MVTMATTHMEIDNIPVPESEHGTDLIFSPTPPIFIPVEHDYELHRSPGRRASIKKNRASKLPKPYRLKFGR